MKLTSLVGHLLELIELIDRSSQPADQVAAHFFRQKRYLGSSDRRFISEYVFGMIRHRRFIESLLEEHVRRHPEDSDLEAPHARYLPLFAAYAVCLEGHRGTDVSLPPEMHSGSDLEPMTEPVQRVVPIHDRLDQGATEEPAKSKPANGELAKGERAKGELAKGGLAKGELAKAELAKAELVQTVSAKAGPGEADLPKAEAAETEATMAEPPHNGRVDGSPSPGRDHGSPLIGIQSLWKTYFPRTEQSSFIRSMTALQGLDFLKEYAGADGEVELLQFAVRYSFQDWMVRELNAQFGSETEQLLRALNMPARATLRVNLSRASREECRLRLLSEGIEANPTLISPVGLTVTRRFNAQSSQTFREGLFELQDEGSQLLSLICDPRPGNIIIDACAGAGGKSLHLADLMGGEGEIIAVDVDRSRLRELERRAARAGVAIIKPFLREREQQERDEEEQYRQERDRQELPTEGPLNGGSPEEVEVRRSRGVEKPARQFRSDELEARPQPHSGDLPSGDIVLVDAPCSGTGTIRRNPAIKWRVSEASARNYSEKQGLLLDYYCRFVRPGGMLVYTTCSLLAWENEEVVRAFLDEHAEFRLRKPESAFCPSSMLSAEGFVRILPHHTDTDGFFAAKMERQS